MIPKKIHYCWLSGEEMPAAIQKCIETWKKIMPDYEYVLWDKNSFDINSIPFVKEAYEVKQWAAAADYIRLYAVYTEGGIYLDADVVIRKSFSDFLGYDFFTSVECLQKTKEGTDLSVLLEHPEQSKELIELGYIQAAVFGAIPEHPYIKDCLDWYRDKHFVLEDGSFHNRQILAPHIYADVAMKYGFNYRNELQFLKNNMVIFPSFVFAHGVHQSYTYSYAVHCCTYSWGDKPIAERIYAVLARNKIIRKLLGMKPVKSLEEQITDIINDV